MATRYALKKGAKSSPLNQGRTKKPAYSGSVFNFYMLSKIHLANIAYSFHAEKFRFYSNSLEQIPALWGGSCIAQIEQKNRL
jgi:hypothetical protein